MTLMLNKDNYIFNPQDKLAILGIIFLIIFHLDLKKIIKIHLKHFLRKNKFTSLRNFGIMNPSKIKEWIFYLKDYGVISNFRLIGDN